MNRSDEMELRENMETPERVLSVAGGTFLLYRALTGKKTGILKALAGGYLFFRGATGHCYLYESVGVEDKSKSIRAKVTLTVNKPRKEVYEFWRKLDNLPLFMDHLEKVTVVDEKLSEWTAIVPGDMGSISWTSEIVQEVRNEHIAWTSLPESTIENSGSVHFSDGGKYGTDVRVEIVYRSPLGTAAGKGILSLLNPAFEYFLKEDIRNFKRYMETGEVPTTVGQPSARES